MVFPAPEDDDYRGGTGPWHWAAKLNAQKVEAIRVLRESDPRRWTYRRLAARFGISKSQAHRIVEFLRWVRSSVGS